ncbi:MAG TPA: c-type cytochrome [Longimicrobiales bacterium]|nr:c-type cytochrome [Longimicrobiales bacterium]
MPRTAFRVRPAGNAARRVAAPIVALLVLLPAEAVAQDRPAQTPPTNLQVLPKEWTRQQVVQVMRNFTAALGARCSDCHVEDDDASDAKPMKEQARVMMRMTTAINDTHLSELPGREEPNVRVTCITCHRGVARPEPIEAIVRRTVDEEGVDAALQRYGELRERHYGGFAYDFTDRPLVAAAEALAEGNALAARRVLEASLELHPRSAPTLFALARVYDTANDKDRAIEYYRRGLEIQPGNAQAQRRLRELTGGA